MLALQAQGPEFGPQSKKTKPSMVVCACNPKAGEAEIGLLPWGLLLALHSKVQANGNVHLKTK